MQVVCSLGFGREDRGREKEDRCVLFIYLFILWAVVVMHALGTFAELLILTSQMRMGQFCIEIKCGGL